MWSATCPLLGNGLLNTFPRQRIHRQQLDNFRCYSARYKYNNRGKVVSYVVRIYPLLDNGCVFYGYASRLNVNENSVTAREGEWSEFSAVQEEGFG
jgi:hypothetical protein